MVTLVKSPQERNNLMKLLLPIFALIIFTIFPSNILAASLEVSKTADFSQITTDFNAGQTIYVRVVTDNNGDDKRALNLRDNNYNLLQSFTFSKSADTYTTNIQAPQNGGYYSLEARIESESSSAISVKTIKIGTPTLANVKVNVNSQKSGQSSNVLGEQEEETNQNSGGNTPFSSPSSQSSSVNDDTSQENTNGGLFSVVVVIVKEVFDFLWPFN